LDLCQFTTWCRARSLDLFAARRADFESFARDLAPARWTRSHPRTSRPASPFPPSASRAVPVPAAAHPRYPPFVITLWSDGQVGWIYA